MASRLIVIDEDRNFVYNAKHSERRRGTEALFYTPNDAGKITTYLVESTTVLATRGDSDDNFYDIYAVNCPSELSFRGHRGMFEMFIVVFLVVGIWQSAEFCCSARFFCADLSGISSAGGSTRRRRKASHGRRTHHTDRLSLRG